jgi:hypothetical protein
MHKMLIPIEDTSVGCIRELYSLKHSFYLLRKLREEASQQGAAWCDDR